jgi:hypothetical protein
MILASMARIVRPTFGGVDARPVDLRVGQTWRSGGAGTDEERYCPRREYVKRFGHGMMIEQVLKVFPALSVHAFEQQSSFALHVRPASRQHLFLSLHWTMAAVPEQSAVV